MFVLLHVWMFIWPLTGQLLECKDGNQRKELSSLFNALLLWEVSICSAALKGLGPLRNEKGATKVWCKKKKNMVCRGKRIKWQVRLETPAGPLETHQ